MNSLLRKLLITTLAAAGVPAVFGEPPKATAARPAPPRSVFVMPSGPHEGRDPFFPESTRPYEDAEAAKPHPVEVMNSFVIKGLSVENGHPMLIINNHTFAVGDDGDVMTPNGRVHLRLLSIRGNTAEIEANGTRRELTIAK